MNLEKLYSQFKLLYLFGCVVIRDKQGRERFRMHVMTKINGWLQVYYFTKIFVMEHTILQIRINHCRVVNFIMINVVQYVLWFFFSRIKQARSLDITHYQQLITQNEVVLMAFEGTFGFGREITKSENYYGLCTCMTVL